MQLDKEIKELVIHLNRTGFKTYYSCAGHAGNGRSGRAYNGCIQISRCQRCQREALRAICQWHGLKGIKIRDVKVSPYGLEQGIAEGTKVIFEPIGLTVEQRVAQLDHKRIPRVCSGTYQGFKVAINGVSGRRNSINTREKRVR